MNSHIPPAFNMEPKLFHIQPACNMNHKTYRKRQSVVMSKPSCKEKVKLLKYEKSTKKLNPEGLSFPDNLMAVLGWRRARA